MKCFFTLCAFAATVFGAKHEAQLSSPQIKPLPESYGQLKPISKPSTWEERKKAAKVKTTKAVKPAAYSAMRTTENCKFPLEVLILQDATNSFEDDVQIMRQNQLENMINSLSASHPGSKFALASFKDIPIYSLGNRDDYCYKLELPLSTDVTPIRDAYAKLDVFGGADPAESQYKALLASALSTKVGWSTNSGVSTKLIVLATDAPPHYADDGLNAYGLPSAAGNSDLIAVGNACETMYYPTADQVKEALLGQEIYLATLVFDPDYMNGLPATSWKWFNTLLGQPDSFVNPLANDASNFWSMLSKTISAIEDAECVFPPPPLPETTTSAPTTKALLPTLPETTTRSPGPLSTTSTGPVPPTKAPLPPIPTTTAAPGGSCPPCPPDVSSCPCVAPEVVIKLAHRPSHLQFIVDNE